MPSAAIDTSLVLRLLTNSPEDQARLALDELTARLTSGAGVFVSDLVVSEAYYALQHHYRMPKAEALGLLSEFLRDSGVTSTGGAKAVLALPRLATAKPGFVDRLIHADAVRCAEEFLTFETAARRLKNARVLRVS